IRAEIAEIAEALAPCGECRSDLFRAKPQRHEDVVLAAKRLFPFTLRQIATMEGKAALRPRASFFVALWLCWKQKIQTCRDRNKLTATTNPPANPSPISPF